MKFCPKKTFEYVGVNSVPSSSLYTTESDIISFHGKEFFNQWKVFMDKRKIKKIKFGNDEGYYYFDYRDVAYTTKQFLDSK
jgi:hypothetical protein